MKPIVILFSAFLLFVSSCSRKEGTHVILLNSVEQLTDSVKLSDIFEIKKIVLLDDENFKLGKIKKIIKKNNLYYIQSEDQPYTVFDSNGKYVTSIGGIGKAKNEYINTVDFDVDDNYVYILGNKTIKKYKKDGAFETEIKLGFPTMGIKKFETDFLLYAPGEPEVLHIVDDNGQNIEAFVDRCDAARMRRAVNFHEFNGEILYHIGYSNQVEIMNPESDKSSIGIFSDTGKVLTLEDENALYKNGDSNRLNEYIIFDGLRSWKNQFIIGEKSEENISICFVDKLNKSQKKLDSSLVIEDEYYPLTLMDFLYGEGCSDDSFISFIYPYSLDIDTNRDRLFENKILSSIVENISNDSNPIIIEYEYKP